MATDAREHEREVLRDKIQDMFDVHGVSRLEGNYRLRDDILELLLEERRAVREADKEAAQGNAVSATGGYLLGRLDAAADIEALDRE